jgi:exopolyphosphatase/guanosine-5'-triphosphate,3'-diphosphate pyrophosphatase
LDGFIPRWEWRTFGSFFGEADERFAEMTPEKIQDSDEVYLVSSAGDKSTKARAGFLDIKSLMQVNEAGLEQWRPVLKAELPLSLANAQRVCSILEAAVPAPAKDPYTLDQLLEELVRSGRQLLAVPVHKRRLRFSLGGCMTEATEVRTEAKESRTLAVESEDPSRVLSLVRELGLSHLPNTSYPRWLWTVTGSEA